MILRLRKKDKIKIGKLCFIILAIFLLAQLLNVSSLYFLIPLFIILVLLINKKKLLIYLAKIKVEKINKMNSLEKKLIYLSSLRYLPSNLTKNIISELVEADISKNVDILFKCMYLLENSNKNVYNNFFISAIKSLYNINTKVAIEFGNTFYISKKFGIVNNTALRYFIIYLNKFGFYKKALKLLNLFKEKNTWHKNFYLIVENNYEIYKHGILYGKLIGKQWSENKNSILYHTSHSLPHIESGYAYRTHWLIKNIKSFNWNITVSNRVGFPNDRYDFRKFPIISKNEIIDSIPYMIEINSNDLKPDNILKYHELSVQTIIKQCKKINPSILHSASNHTCGLAATDAAKRLGIPSIYEIRGFWHYTRASKEEGYRESEHFKMIHNLELQAAKNASHVFAITNGIRNKLIEGGVDKESISLLPNGVDVDKFTNLRKDLKLINALSLKGSVVIGYIGAFVDYEGLDYLIKAIEKIKNKGLSNFKVLLVGDGLISKDLKILSKQLGLDNYIIFMGRIPHEDIEKYYSIMDIMVYSRKGFEVCELVSPLKPLEAMAMKKTILASSVKALSEMIIPNETGLIHEKDNIDDLANELYKLIISKELRDRLSNNAYDWVRENRTWKSISKIVDVQYKKLI